MGYIARFTRTLDGCDLMLMQLGNNNNRYTQEGARDVDPGLAIRFACSASWKPRHGNF